jgi:hypothetical protein
MLAEHTRCLTSEQKTTILGASCAELYRIDVSKLAA